MHQEKGIISSHDNKPIFFLLCKEIQVIFVK